MAPLCNLDGAEGQAFEGFSPIRWHGGRQEDDLERGIGMTKEVVGQLHQDDLFMGRELGYLIDENRGVVAEGILRSLA